MIVAIHIGRITMKGNFVTAASKQSRGAEDPKQQQMRNMKKKTAIRKCDAGFFDKSWQESGDASALYLNCLTDITYTAMESVWKLNPRPLPMMMKKKKMMKN